MAREQDRQRKLQRKAKKDVARRKQKQRASAVAWAASNVVRRLDEADELIERGESDSAIELLEEMAQRFPKRVDVLSRLAEAHLQSGDRWSYQATCARITVAAPDEPRGWLALAAAAMGNLQPSTARQAFERMTAAWPDHPEAAKARDVLKTLREFLASECRRLGLDEELGLRVLLLHDEATMQLHLGRYDATCQTAARLLALHPTFAPALNNRSEAHFRSGRYDDAIADSRRVLEFAPTNFHALGNATRYLYLAGRFEEAHMTAAALKASTSDDPDAFLKKAEAFAMLGDWDAVRQAVQEGRSVWKKAGGVPALAEHLAGVALANGGDLKAARRHWRQAADGRGSFAWAEENLDDSKKAVGAQHGPWAFPLESWIPRGVIASLLERIETPWDDAEATRNARVLFERHPHLESLADPLLKRGDPTACELIIGLAGWTQRPALLAACKEFALGRRGSDDLRMKALLMLSQAKYVDGTVELWRDGEQRPIALLSQEIYLEATGDLPSKLTDLMVEASELMNEGRGAEAEPLFDEVLRSRPDDVSAQYNRSVAIRLQGRDEEALDIVRSIHRERPEYVFARTTLADECIAAGDLEGAQALIAPIAQLTRLHRSEYAAWCSTNISLALARKDANGARKLLDAWEQIDPDDHRIAIWKTRLLCGRGLVGRLNRYLQKSLGEAK